MESRSPSKTEAVFKASLGLHSEPRIVIGPGLRNGLIGIMIDFGKIRIREFMAQGQYAKAAELAKDILIDSPDDLSTSLLLTECYLHLPDGNTQAQIQARKSLKMDDNNSQAHTLFAQALLASPTNNFTQTAQKHLHRALEIDPENQHARQLLQRIENRPQENKAQASTSTNTSAKPFFEKGLELIQLGQYKNAETYFSKALEIDPKYVPAWNGLGFSQYITEQIPEAEVSYRKALEIFPTYVPAWNGLGNIQENTGLTNEAETSYRKALEIDPKYVPAWNGLGNIQENTGQPNEAEASYRKILEIDPKYEPAWHRIGIIQHRAGRTDKAEASYHEALKINPRFSNAWNELGKLQFDTGQIFKAEMSYRKALELDPKNAHAWHGLGVVQSDTGRAKEAEESYREALKINPKFSDAWNGLGNAQSGMGRSGEAEISYYKALELDPKNAHAWNGLGKVQQRTERAPEAEASYRKALEIFPKLWHAWVNLARLFTEHPHLQRNGLNASRCFGRYLALDGPNIDRGYGIHTLKNHPSWPLFSWDFAERLETDLSKSFPKVIFQQIQEIKRFHFELAMAGKRGLKELSPTRSLDRIYLLHLYGDPVRALNEAKALWLNHQSNPSYAVLAWFLAMAVLDKELAEKILQETLPHCSQIAKGERKVDEQGYFNASLLLRESGENDLALQSLRRCESGIFEYPARWLEWEILQETSPSAAESLTQKISKEETRRLQRGQGLRDFPLSLPLGINNLPGGNYPFTNDWETALPLLRHLMLQEILAGTMLTFHDKHLPKENKNVPNDGQEDNVPDKPTKPWHGPTNVKEWALMHQLQVIARPAESFEQCLDELIAGYEGDEKIIPFLKPPDQHWKFSRMEFFARQIKTHSLESREDVLAAIKALHTLIHRNHLREGDPIYGELVAYILAKRSWNARQSIKTKAEKTIPFLALQLVGVQFDAASLTALIGAAIPAFDILKWFRGPDFPDFSDFNQFLEKQMALKNYQEEIKTVLAQFQTES